jgi:hypothetical protein
MGHHTSITGYLIDAHRQLGHRAKLVVESSDVHATRFDKTFSVAGTGTGAGAGALIGNQAGGGGYENGAGARAGSPVGAAQLEPRRATAAEQALLHHAATMRELEVPWSTRALLLLHPLYHSPCQRTSAQTQTHSL